MSSHNERWMSVSTLCLGFDGRHVCDVIFMTPKVVDGVHDIPVCGELKG